MIKRAAIATAITATTATTFMSASFFCTSASTIASTTASASATTRSGLTKADMKIGKLYIGEQLNDIEKQYGHPSVKTIVHGNGAPRWEYTKQGFAVNADPVWQIQVTKPSVGSTPRGVHVGSSEETVRHAYPNLKLTFPHQLFLQSHGYDVDFFIKNGVVNQIILTKELT